MDYQAKIAKLSHIQAKALLSLSLILNISSPTHHIASATDTESLAWPLYKVTKFVRLVSS